MSCLHKKRKLKEYLRHIPYQNLLDFERGTHIRFSHKQKKKIEFDNLHPHN